MIKRQTIKATPKTHNSRNGLDRLGMMFNVQKAFQEKYSTGDFSALSKSAAEDHLVKTARNIMMEGAELMDQLNWKEWKKTKENVDWVQVKYEVADIFAFAMNAAILSGMDAEELFQHYMQKAEVNVKRQNEKY